MDTNVFKGRSYMAQKIDTILIDILVKKLLAVFGSLNVSFAETLKPEIEAFVQICYGLLSLNVHMSPAMEATFLKMKEVSYFIKLKFVLLILLGWGFERFQKLSILLRWRTLPESNPLRKLWKMLQLFDIAMKILGFANILGFCYSGEYPSVLHRLLAISLFDNDSREQSVIQAAPLRFGASSAQYSYVYRQILWMTASSVFETVKTFGFGELQRTSLEFMRFAVNDVTKDMTSLKKNLFSLWRKDTTRVRQLDNSTSTLVQSGTVTVCSECNNSPAENPCMSNCGHCYCYICIFVKIEACSDYCFEDIMDGSLSSTSEGLYACRECGEKIFTLQQISNIR